MLELRDVSKSYAGTTVIHPLSLSVEAGETAVLLGPSGCGKTTLLRMVAGLVKPTAGEVAVDREVLDERTVSAIRRKLGYVIQEGGLFPHLTGRENVALMAQHAGWTRDRVEARVRELVEITRFPLAGLARYPNELSGGQRQRLSLMRALFLSPRLLLLDEPFGALDPLIRAGLQRDLLELFAGSGVTVLLVTHDLVEASRLADRVCVMNAGQIVQQGEFKQVYANPANDFVREFISSQVVEP